MIKKIDVPGDGNCLFWSSMLAYLEPVKKDENKLKERCQKIFNSVEHWKDIFDYLNKTNNVNNIKHLVLLFRINVIEYIKKNINEEQKNILIALLPEFNLKNEIHLRLHNIKEIKTFEGYCEIMKKDGIYGDHYELFNISEFLHHNIIVFANNDSKKCIANINENFEEKITLNYVNNNHYQYFVKELEYDSGYDSKLESNNKKSEEIEIDNFENFSSIIELKKRQIMTEITKLENLNKDRESSSKTLQSLTTQIRLLEQESLKLIEKNKGINFTVINLAQEKITKILSDIKEMEIRLDLLNSKIQIQEKELELEIKDKKLVELIGTKREIELEIQRLEKYQQQLEINIIDNNNQMQAIFNDNKNFKNQLIIEINEIDFNIKTLQNNIYVKTNYISRLEKEIANNAQDIVSKQKDVQNIVQNIQIMQNWRDSIWRRIIVVLTLNIFCSYKNIQKKIDKANVNIININKERNDLLVTNSEKLRQKKDLCTEILEHQKEITRLKEKKLDLDMKLDDFDKNTKTKDLKKELETKNKKIQSLLENVKAKTDEEKLKLFNVSLALIGTEKSLTELKKIKTEKKSPDKANKNWEEKVANTLRF